ncbi:hypothetical protein K32_35050 [Kaistia sp. 32K]|uniref:hypothetical protein n=1 Tax=Kaistia sp. 32K TaxID=2795690 RepID=UPI0019157403|nr:hypothetical protein [Kaistia sp. 32K]BCP54888.1 hypothetical protein K32_35050 [Kaistia sp. 32K]
MALPFDDASVAGMARTEPIETVQRSVSGYVADMAKDLRAIATNADLPVLAYLLSVAEEEARSTHRSLRTETTAKVLADADGLYPSPDDS